MKWSIPIAWHYELYLPTLDNKETEGSVLKNGVYYTLYKTVEANDNNYGIDQQTCPPLPGFTAPASKDGTKIVHEEGMSDGRPSITAQYYYTRNEYKLTLQNHSKIKTEMLPYGDDLDGRVDSTRVQYRIRWNGTPIPSAAGTPAPATMREVSTSPAALCPPIT